MDCEDDLKEFVTTIEELGNKLGPMLLHFGYFNKSALNSGTEFLARLRPFLQILGRNHKFAVEIRNKYGLNAEVADLLREHRVALVFSDQSSVPRPWEIQKSVDMTMSDFTYIRWLGDRK